MVLIQRGCTQNSQLYSDRCILSSQPVKLNKSWSSFWCVLDFCFAEQNLLRLNKGFDPGVKERGVQPERDLSCLSFLHITALTRVGSVRSDVFCSLRVVVWQWKSCKDLMFCAFVAMYQTDVILACPHKNKPTKTICYCVFLSFSHQNNKQTVSE